MSSERVSVIRELVIAKIDDKFFLNLRILTKESVFFKRT